MVAGHMLGLLPRHPRNSRCMSNPFLLHRSAAVTRSCPHTFTFENKRHPPTHPPNPRRNWVLTTYIACLFRPCLPALCATAVVLSHAMSWHAQVFRYFPGTDLSAVDGTLFACNDEDEVGCYDPTVRPW